MPRRSKDTPPEQTPTSVDGEGEGSSNTTTTSDVKLPPLTVQEFKTYNSMAVRMEYFVTHSPSPSFLNLNLS